MVPHFSMFVLLVFISLGCSLQSEEQTYQGYKLWPNKMHMLEMKELKATFGKENQGKIEEAITMEEVEEEKVSSKEITQRQSNAEHMETNRIKREIGSKPIHSSSSMESCESAEDCKVKHHEISKHSTKRQTSITGNGNRLSNLINLPVRLNVLTNVLSILNEGVLDPKEKPLDSVTIKGNHNTISSLVNAPIDVDAVVNLLSKVDKTKSGGKDTNAHGGVVDGLLGGLLGGGGASKGGKGLVGGLLDGVLGDGSGSGLLGGLLGDTLGDLLGALLGGKGLVGGLLQGLDGKGLVTEILDNLLGGVVGLVENLLELLLGLLDGLLLGIGSAHEHKGGVAGHASEGLNIEGNNNHVSSLVNAPIRIKGLINVLSSLKQELKQQMKPSAGGSQHAINIKGTNNKVSSLINLPLDLNLDLNVLSSSSKTGRGERETIENSSPDGSSAPPKSATPESSPPVTIPSTAPAGTNIQGTDNIVSSLLNVVPDVNLNLNLLSEVTELLVGSDVSSVAEAGSNPNEICFDVPVSETDTSITGSNNKVSNVINTKPKINLDFNLLSNVKEIGSSKGPTQRVCIIKPNKESSPPKEHMPKPSEKPSMKPPVKPPVKTTISPTMAPAVTPPVTPPALPSATLPNEICFNILVDPSGTNIEGNSNEVMSLLNLEPNINLGLNLLSNVQQTNKPSNLVIKRICIPRPVPPTPPSTPSPILPHPVITHYPPAPSRCFRRTCASWRQFVDYDCLNAPNEYPKYTIARDIF